MKIYYRDRTWLYVFDLPEEEPERGEAILRYLRTTDYGRCVYRCSNDQPDHYVTSMEFAGGVTVNFSIEAFTSYMGRRTRIMGTRGDIVGDMESFTLTDFATGEKTVYDANAIDAENYKGAGHGGGDAGMIRDWIESRPQAGCDDHEHSARRLARKPCDRFLPPNGAAKRTYRRFSDN